MRIISKLVFWSKNLVFRLKVVMKYNELLKNQKLDATSLDDLNWGKRKKIVEHAYDNTLFYKEFYDLKGFHPRMLRDKSDWDRVPVLERDMIRNNIDNIVMVGVSPTRLSTSTTGGSTGQPLKVFLDKRFPNEVLVWRYLGWWNIFPSDSCAITHRRVPTTIKAKILDTLLWFPTRRIFLNATSFEEKDMEVFVQKLVKKKIIRVVGYIGTIEKVAEYILKNGIVITHIKHVWTTSAPLTLGARRKIEQAFNCKVMDQYGSCEMPSIAQQCTRCGGLHVNSDIVHVDIIDNKNMMITDFSIGDVLMTNMESFAFPLIKYRIGDRSNFISSAHNKCGLPFPLLNHVSGRISDAIETPSGIVLSGDYLTTIFDDYTDNILAFQVVQKSDYSVVLKVVLNRKAESDGSLILEYVKSILEKKIKYEVPITVVEVEYISDDRGKTRYIISELK